MSDEQTNFTDNGQTWRLAWHPTVEPPPGKPHGSSGVCITDGGGVVLISEDGLKWDFPGGRPEVGETWDEILRRELREEACADVIEARLLGFARSECLAGREAGLVLVRAFWLARVSLGLWEPQFEIGHRRVVLPNELLALTPQVYRSMYRRMLAEADMGADEEVRG
jgi:ADP-ribose pyrophosphatase YjhB (NUDIX family)